MDTDKVVNRLARKRSLTTWSLIALAVGLLLGALGRVSGSPAFGAVGQFVKPLGNLWLAALQMIVLPLVVTRLLTAIVGARGGESVGALGLRALALFLVMLVAGGLLTLAVVPPIVAFYHVDPATLESLKATGLVPETAAQAGSIGSLLSNLLPRSIFDAAARGDLLPVLLFTMLFGSAVTRLPEEPRRLITRAADALAHAMLQCALWVLMVTPPGVLVLSYSLALQTGVSAASMMGVFVLITAGVLLAFTGLLYPLTAMIGRTTMRAFARAVGPAQLVAISTRSSIAALPALIEGALTELRLPPSATSFVLPLSVSVFKVNRTISSTVKLIFLAHVCGVPLEAGTVITFLLTIILLSFGTPGISSGDSGFGTMPAYLAAGMPIQAVVLLEAVGMIPDIFRTLLNVTGDMAVATWLSRSSRAASAMAAGQGARAIPAR